MGVRSAKTLADVELHRVEMIDSYVTAIYGAGGSPKKFLKEIDTMTVAEMIDTLAQNGVRFTLEKEEEDESEYNAFVNDEEEIYEFF